MDKEMYEEMAVKKLEQLKVFTEEGELNKEATKEKWQGHLKVMEEAIEEEKLNHEIAVCRQEEFIKNPAVLQHQATFVFEVESKKWQELQTKKLLRSFERDVNGALLTVERIEVLIEVLKKELETL